MSLKTLLWCITLTAIGPSVGCAGPDEPPMDPSGAWQMTISPAVGNCGLNMPVDKTRTVSAATPAGWIWNGWQGEGGQGSSSSFNVSCDPLICDAEATEILFATGGTAAWYFNLEARFTGVIRGFAMFTFTYDDGRTCSQELNVVGQIAKVP